MSTDLEGVEKDVVAAAYTAEAMLESRISRREMRRAGLTVLNVRRHARHLAIAGEITSDMSQEQIRDIVLDDVRGDNPVVFDKVNAVNWEAILEFITKLLPLILQILAIFGL